MKIIKEAAAGTYERDKDLADTVAGIISRVKNEGDAAILDLARRFDGVDLKSIRVGESDIAAAYKQVDEKTVEDLKFAAGQIRFFAEKQLASIKPLETPANVPGVTLGHRLIPVARSGAYVPAGRHPLPSSALMNIIPAKIAGVKNVSASCPPSKEHAAIHPAVLVAMDIAGADNIFCAGGAQAIAAMAYGTETITRVDLITGPGNRFVTEAKRQVFGDVGIDSLAGPSEVLIIADDSANPEYLAIDLLAQCEHDPDARAVLVTTAPAMVDEVEKRLKAFADELGTGKTAFQAWMDNGRIIVADNLTEAIAISNENAPEHLELHTRDCLKVSEKLTSFGSLFIGEYAPVAFGDYCSGTNHSLPTMGAARYSNGIWAGTFMKTSFFQHITKEGCENLSEAAMNIAGLEGLPAHQKSVAVRGAS